MSEPKPLVTNAGDQKQLDAAADKVANRDRQQREELVKLLKLPEFRNFAWRHLGALKMFESIFRQSSEMAFLAGKQDAAHRLWNDLTEADPESVLTMLKENFAKERA